MRGRPRGAGAWVNARSWTWTAGTSPAVTIVIVDQPLITANIGVAVHAALPPESATGLANAIHTPASRHAAQILAGVAGISSRDPASPGMASAIAFMIAANEPVVPA